MQRCVLYEYVVYTNQVLLESAKDKLKTASRWTHERARTHNFKKSKDKWEMIFQKTNLMKYCFGTDNFKILLTFKNTNTKITVVFSMINR
jgi:hypothetical protein